MPLKQGKELGAAILEFALSAIVLLPLFFGTIALGLNLGRGIQVTQVSRDVAVMYSRGVDFSAAGGQAIARKLAAGLSLEPSGNAVVILSQVTIVRSSDCVAGGFADVCGNRDQPVFLNRIVIGNSSLRSSNYGTPSGMNAQGNLPAETYLNQMTARGSARLATDLAEAGVAQRQGEIAYIVEAWFATPDLNPFGTAYTGGVYAKSIY